MINKIIEKILNLLDFLKLTSDKILIGLLIIGLSISIYLNIELSRDKISFVNNIRDECEEEKDSLKKVIIYNTINNEKEKYLLLIKYYKKTDSISKSVERNILNIKKQQKLINRYGKN